MTGPDVRLASFGIDLLIPAGLPEPKLDRVLQTLDLIDFRAQLESTVNLLLDSNAVLGKHVRARVEE